MWNRTRKLAAVGALVLVMGVTAPSAAMANTPDTSKLSSTQPSAPAGAETDAPPPLDESDPAVAAKLEDLRAAGAEIIGGSTSTYVAEGEDAADASTRAFPSGCGLTVILSRSGSTVTSSNLTSCAAPWTVAEMDSFIGFLAWGHYNNVVAEDTEYSGGGLNMSMDYSYTCVNTTNQTWFRTETYGELFRGNTRYTAAAYDVIDDQPCGTS